MHESSTSRIQVENYHYLLAQVQLLCNQVDIDYSSVLHQYKYCLNRLPTNTLQGIAYQILTNLHVDSQHTPFHNNVKRCRKSAWRDLTPNVLRRKDQVTMQYHHSTKDKKRR